jgi:hypothetical protein
VILTAFQRHYLLGSLAAVALLLGARAPPLAAAASGREIGQAEVVVSRVHGLIGEITRELAVKDNVFSQEVIETAADAATRIAFRDGTQLSMGPSSRVTLDRYVYDPDTGVGQLAVNFLSGVFEFVSGSMSEAGYDLRTPFAHLSVRGTQIVIDTSTKLVAVPQGSVLVRTNDGQSFQLSSSECVMQEPNGNWRTITGSCSQFLGRYSTMVALLVSGVQPTAGPQGPAGSVIRIGLGPLGPNPLQRQGYASPDRGGGGGLFRTRLKPSAS